MFCHTYKKFSKLEGNKISTFLSKSASFYDKSWAILQNLLLQQGAEHKTRVKKSLLE